MSATDHDPLSFADVKVGDELPPFDLEVTSTTIVAGAIASRDFMPAHHDRDYAASQGAPDIFMNILTTNGYVARYVTDWAGSECKLKKIDIRLGLPVFPGQTMKFRGEVLSTTAEDDEGVVEVKLSATTDYGDHATGTVTLTLPLA